MSVTSLIDQDIMTCLQEMKEVFILGDFLASDKNVLVLLFLQLSVTYSKDICLQTLFLLFKC